MRPHGLYSPWNSLGQNTRVGSLSLLQGIFLTQESNQGLLHCRQILYQLNYQGSPQPQRGEVLTNCPAQKFPESSVFLVRGPRIAPKAPKRNLYTSMAGRVKLSFTETHRVSSLTFARYQFMKANRWMLVYFDNKLTYLLGFPCVSVG